jgi:uncharacterized protein YjiS (DUF1127 family)
MNLSHASGDDMSFVERVCRLDITNFETLAQESDMSTVTHPSMTNNHATGFASATGLLSRLGAVLRTWRERHAQRSELNQWSERDICDAGLSRGDVLYEASKPFWRA